MKYLLSLVFLAIATSGCAHDLRFTSFGEMNPEFEREVIEGYAALVKEKKPGPSSEDVRVYMKSMPPGIKVDSGVFSVAEDSTRTVIGEFRWISGGINIEYASAGSELAKIAKSAGGNELVILELLKQKDYVYSAKGIVILNKEPAAKEAAKSDEEI